MSKGKFKCWSCKGVYVKKVDEDWGGWTCPLCGVETGGTGSQVDKRTGANITLPPVNYKQPKKRFQDCYQYEFVASRMDWNSDESIGQMLRKTKISLKDLAIVFHSKLARWNDEKLYDAFDKTFADWLKKLKPEAKKMWEEMHDEDRQLVRQITNQLRKIRDDEQ